MAFRTSRLPLFGEYNSRLGATSKDRRFKNVFIDLERGEDGKEVAYVIKRPGLTVNAADATDAGRGIYGWTSHLYKVCGDSVYKDSTEIKSNLTNSTGLVQWTEEKSSGLLVFRDNDKIVTINSSGTVTEQTDAQIPTGLVPGIVALDTYIFVMNATGEIYNCDLDDITSWTAGNFVTTSIEPGAGKALIKHHDYLVALCDWHLEFFYNAVNPTGSPLSPVQGASDLIGCASGDSVYADENIAVWVSRTRTGGAKIAKLEGMKVSYLSTPGIERILNQSTTNLDSSRAFGVRIAGHHFYVLTLTTADITLVCDIDYGIWYEWNSDPGTEAHFTCLASTYLDGVCYLLDEDNGDDYKMNVGTYQDNGGDINVEIVTGKWDGGSTRQKFIDRIDVIGDEQTSTSNITLEQTVDDYQNYQTARTIDMSKTTPCDTQFGAVERAAYRIKHAANTPLRLEALELSYRLGSHAGGSY